MADAKLSLRPDPVLDADLETVMRAGLAANRTAALRVGLHLAAEAIRRDARDAELRAWAEKIAADPQETAVAAQILADFAADEDGWTTRNARESR
jgi:hypothetical protein